MVKKIFILISFLTIFLIQSFSNDIEINVSSSSIEVVPNENFQISIEVINADNPQLENVENLDPSVKILNVGTNYESVFSNGIMSSKMIYQVYCKITKEGSYSIGPFVVKSNGKIFKSKVIKIEVTNSAVSSKNQNTNSQLYEEDISPGDQKNGRGNDVIIKLDVDKNEVYSDDFIDTSVLLFIKTQIRLVNYESMKFPTSAWIENYSKNDNNHIGSVIIGNDTYEKFEVEKKRVYISKDGMYTIQPVVMNLLAQKSIFDDPANLSIHSDPVKFRVKPLPSGKPDSFKGAVGDFKIDTTISSNNISTKEPITLKIRLYGKGNFYNIKDIGYNVSDDFQEYSSKSNSNIDQNNSEKTWEILLVPKKSGDKKIIVNDFSYFDPKKVKYITIPGKEYQVNVKKGNEKEDTDTVIVTDNTNVVKDVINGELANIKTFQGNKSSVYKYNFGFLYILISYILLIAALGIFVFFKYYIFKKISNESFFQSKNAYQNFISRLKKLENTGNKEKPENISDKISVIMENYFIKKFKIDSVKFTSKTINEKLGNLISEDLTKKVKETFSEIDMIRFGGLETNNESIIDLLKNVKTLISEIDKKFT